MPPRPLFNQSCGKSATAGVAPVVFPAVHAHVIRSDSEAIEIAQRFASEFAKDAATRSRERLLPFAEVEALSQSGLWAMNVPCGYGGAGVSYAAVAEVNVYVPAERVAPTHLAYRTPSVHGPVSQIIHAAVDLGIARAVIAETIDFVRTKTRPWGDSGQDHASQDPYTIAAISDLNVRLHSAEAVLFHSGRIIDEGLKEKNAETVAEASIAVAKAKVLTTEIALLATNKLFELAGTRSTLGEFNLDRHWRNARTHTLHDPVRWKYHAIGNYYLNGEKPPRYGAI